MKRFFAWVGVLVVAVAAGFGLGALTYRPPNPELGAGQVPTAVSLPPTVTTTPTLERKVLPDVVGMRRAAAEEKLDELGILFLISPVKGKDDDRVVRQAPSPGISVAQAKHVMLSVRCEPRPCLQPPEGRQMYDPCTCLWR